MPTRAQSTESVLVVEASSEERGRYGAWLEREGFPVLVCPGPTEPDYLCIGSRNRTCPLASGAALVVLDMSLDSEAVVMGTPAEELLGLYLLSGHRVVVLGLALVRKSLASSCGCRVTRSARSSSRRSGHSPHPLPHRDLVPACPGTSGPERSSARRVASTGSTRGSRQEEMAMIKHGRTGAAGAAILVLMVLAAACTGGDSGEGGGGLEGDVAAPASLNVSLTEFAITPDVIRAPAGQALSFHVTNDGAAPHTFAVDTGGGVEETRELQPGDTQTLEVAALQAGDYRISCTIAGHADLGMVGSVTVEAGGAVAAGTSGATGATGSHSGMSVQEMLDGHREGVEAFPAETEALGNQPLEPTIENGAKVFELTAEEIRWETSPGVFVDAMGFNGTVPGPEIRVNPGDKVRIILRNEMSQPTTLHLHGVTVPNGMDGVPYITQDPILPGGFFTYEFEVVDPPGMYVYHSHFNSTEQVGKGLYGAFYVEPKGGDWGEVYGEPIDVESTLFLGDGPTGYVLNGKGFPATQPIVASEGDTVLIHLANDGAQIHPMHLHGFHFEVVAQDGFVLSRGNRYMADTLMIAPGQRFDVLVHADYPGVWAYHCHILPHVEGPQGMYGMVTALVVQ